MITILRITCWPLPANFAYLATQGILLTNYLAVTHPSQPNYVAAVGGSTHGISSDSFSRISSSSKTIVDLLEAGGVSWSEYQEDMPYSGFEGNYVNQKTGANDYVRKHKYDSSLFEVLRVLEFVEKTLWRGEELTRDSGLMSYDSVTSNNDRLAKIKNFTMFNTDLANDKLPQWMFITPNMSTNPPPLQITKSFWRKQQTTDTTPL